MAIPYTDKIGFFDYNDSSLPQSILVDTYTRLDNDTLGIYTNIAYKPTSMTTLWNSTTNQFDFSELSLGDMLDIRIDVDVTTSNSNQDVNLKLVLGIGGDSYDLELDFISPKTAGTYKMVSYTGVYMGDINTLNNPGEIQIRSDNAITSGVNVNGWYCKVVRR